MRGLYPTTRVSYMWGSKAPTARIRSEEHTSELQSQFHLVCRRLLEKKKMLTMTNLSTECLIHLPKLGYYATPFNQLLKQNAKRELRLRLGTVTVAEVLAAQPVTTNL